MKRNLRSQTYRCSGYAINNALNSGDQYDIDAAFQTAGAINPGRDAGSSLGT